MYENLRRGKVPYTEYLRRIAMKHTGWIGLILLCCVFVMSLFLMGSDAAGKRSKDVEVLILSTTDTNGELEPCG